MRRSPFDLPCQNTTEKKVWEIRDGNSSFFIKMARGQIVGMGGETNMG